MQKFIKECSSWKPTPPHHIRIPSIRYPSIHPSIFPHFPAQHTGPSGHILSFHWLVHYLCAHHSPSINISPNFKVFNQIFEFSHMRTPYMVTTTLPTALASTALVPSYVHHWNGYAGLCPPAHWLYATCPKNAAFSSIFALSPAEQACTIFLHLPGSV